MQINRVLTLLILPKNSDMIKSSSSASSHISNFNEIYRNYALIFLSLRWPKKITTKWKDMRSEEDWGAWKKILSSMRENGKFVHNLLLFISLSLSHFIANQHTMTSRFRNNAWQINSYFTNFIDTKVFLLSYCTSEKWDVTQSLIRDQKDCC